MFFCAGYSCLFIVFYLFYRSIPVSIAGGLLIRFLLPRYRMYLGAKNRRRLNEQFKDLLTILSASIEAGRQMEEALVEADDAFVTMYEEDSPMVIELHHMRRGILENNDSDIRLLSDLAERSGCQDIQNFVQVYRACRDSGGDIAAVIAHTCRMMTDKMEISEQIAVLTAQKKLEGRIISAMPIAMLLVLNLLSPAYISVLYAGLAGRAIMTICLFGICFGIWLMEKLTDVEV